jgi:hypothetical protein
MALAVGHGNFIQPIALRPTQQAVEDFAAINGASMAMSFGVSSRRASRSTASSNCAVERSTYSRAASAGRARHGARVGDQAVISAGSMSSRIARFGSCAVASMTRPPRHRDREHQVIERVVGKELVGQAHFLAALAMMHSAGCASTGEVVGLLWQLRNSEVMAVP